MSPPVDSCAFLPCSQVDECSLPGGCVQGRFPAPERSVATEDPLKQNAPALNATKPARTNRDPRFIKRRRKALTK